MGFTPQRLILYALDALAMSDVRDSSESQVNIGDESEWVCNLRQKQMGWGSGQSVSAD